MAKDLLVHKFLSMLVSAAVPVINGMFADRTAWHGVFYDTGREESEEAPPGDTSFASDMDRRGVGKEL